MKRTTNYLVIIFCISAITLAAQKGVSHLSTNTQQESTYNKYAIIGGISDYKDVQIPDLKYADKDAFASGKWLKSTHSFLMYFILKR